MIKVTGIVWDTDNYKVKLPKEVIIDNMDFDEVVDFLSDKYGWCIKTIGNIDYIKIKNNKGE